MALPTNREQFKQFCLRKLGWPVVEVNVSDEQVDDRVDEALQYYADYHFDATEQVYYRYEVQAEDKVNGYITLPENIIGAVEIFDIGSDSISSVNNMFNIRYQIALNDLYNLTNVGLVPYYTARLHLSTIRELLVGRQPIRFQRHTNRLDIDMDWDLVEVGQYLIVRAYQVIDPDEYTDVWKDRWLARYATALIKQQWGNNLKKFEGVQLPSGITFNGQTIYDEATAEIAEMEGEMINTYSIPVCDMIG